MLGVLFGADSIVEKNSNCLGSPVFRQKIDIFVPIETTIFAA